MNGNTCYHTLPFTSYCPAGKSCMTLLTMARYEWFEEWEGTKLGKRGQNYLDLKNSMAQELLDWALVIFPQLKDKVCIHICNGSLAFM